MAMSIEEIVAAQQAIVDSAGDEPLTDEQANRYEELEKDLAVAQRNQEIRKRQVAYKSTAAVVHVGVPKQDDTLDRAWDAYLRTGTGNADLTQYRAQSLSDSAGGYMVPASSFRQKLVEQTKAFGGLAAYVDEFTTGTGTPIEYPSLDDTANSGSITSEGSTFAAGADLTFGTITLGAYKYTSQGTGSAPLKVSVELLQDAQFDVSSIVARKLGERIGRKQAADWCTGTGTTLPVGICHANLTPDYTLAAPGTITYSDLLSAEFSVDLSYQRDGQWVMHSKTWQKIRGILDGGSSGRPIVLDQAASGARTQPDKTLMGYNVILDNSMPQVSGGAGRNFMVFGDLQEAYVIRRVQDVVVVVNPYSSAASGQVEYVAWARADGNIQNRSAIGVIKG